MGERLWTLALILFPEWQVQGTGQDWGCYLFVPLLLSTDFKSGRSALPQLYISKTA